MEIEKITNERRVYDPKTQPISYAVVYGLVPELERLIIREQYSYDLNLNLIQRRN